MKNLDKVVLIGCGQVGCSFLYSAMNQGIAKEYVLIDFFADVAEGNVLDFLDAKAGLPTPFADVSSTTDYNACKDADLIVITAGRPQKPGETRLDMVIDNAKIMQEIAKNVKKSGFKGITIIASNPVDVLTNVYIKQTGFEKHTVIGSGTTLDSARLKRLVGAKLGISPKSVETYLMGEHGDSSVAIWSASSVMGKPFTDFIKEGKLKQDELDKMKDEAVHMAYKIIEKKRSTYYGIGVYLAQIAKTVLFDAKEVMMVGCLLDGEYGQKGIVTGVPAVITRDGWKNVIEWNLEKNESEKFKKSCDELVDVWKLVEKQIKF